MPPVLSTIIPDPKDFSALKPDELAGIMVEPIPSVSQHSGFMLENLMTPLCMAEAILLPPKAKLQWHSKKQCRGWKLKVSSSC